MIPSVRTKAYVQTNSLVDRDERLLVRGLTRVPSWKRINADEQELVPTVVCGRNHKIVPTDADEQELIPTVSRLKMTIVTGWRFGFFVVRAHLNGVIK
jgi:hypothetical protein